MSHGKRQRRAEAKGAARLAVLAGNALLHLLDFTEQAQGGFVITLAQRRHVQTTRGTVEQPHTEAVFQLDQTAADKLLGQAQLLGGGGKTAGLHDLAKQAHVFEGVHCRFSVDILRFYSLSVATPQAQCGNTIKCGRGLAPESSVSATDEVTEIPLSG